MCGAHLLNWNLTSKHDQQTASANTIQDRSYLVAFVQTLLMNLQARAFSIGWMACRGHPNEWSTAQVVSRDHMCP